MVSRDTFERASNYGFTRLLLSIDLWIPIIITCGTYYFYDNKIDTQAIKTFINISTSVSISLIAVILTGIAILISFSNDEFLAFIYQSDIYDRILFIFEYDVLLSISVTGFGIFLQSMGHSRVLFYIFMGAFLHLLFAVFRLVPLIITFGEKKAQHSGIRGLEGLDVGEDLSNEKTPSEDE